MNPYGCESSVDIKVIVDDPEHPYVEPQKPDSGTTLLTSKTAVGTVFVMKSGDDMQIFAAGENAQLSIYDLQGVLLMRRLVHGNATIPVQSFSQKPYVVKISVAGKIVYQKILR